MSYPAIMSARRKATTALLLMTALVTPGGAESPAPAEVAGQARFSRGVTSVVESPMVLPDTVAAETTRLGAVRGVPVGIVIGVGRTIGRQASGVVDVVGAMGDATPAWNTRGEEAMATVADGPPLRVSSGLR